MSRLNKYVIVVLFLLIIFEIILIAPRTVDQSPEKVPTTFEMNIEESEKTQDGQKMVGVHVVASKELDKEWELWSKEAVNAEKSDLWSLNGVRAIFYGEEDVEFEVVGERGTYDASTKNIVIDGEVQTKTSNGFSFDTPQVVYTSSERSLKSPEKVEMKGPKEPSGKRLNLIGNSMQASLEDSRIELLDKVIGEKPLKDRGQVFINSERAEFSGKSKFARFLGEVTMDHDGMRIFGPEATIYYQGANNKVDSIFLKGGVQVSDRKKYASADSVELYLDLNKYILKGDPRVVQGSDELAGEQIIFLDGGKRVRVKKAKAKVSKENLEN